MENSINSPAARLHPLVVTAAASVTVVSLLGAAAIMGLYPSSHGKAMPADTTLTTTAQVPGYLSTQPAGIPVAQPGLAVPLQARPTRFQMADGRVFEEVTSNAPYPRAPSVAAYPAERLQAPAPVMHRKVVHHYAQTSYREPAYVQVQPGYAAHPVRTYVSEMNPVGTGLGAVVGGVLGHQVGGGNGKKLATVAGVLLGGYAGNEVAHDRNPLSLGNQ